MKVQTSLNFLANASESPAVYNYSLPESEREVAPQYERQPIWIESARDLHDTPALTTRGFELTEQHSAVDDFYDDRAVRDLYYREVEELVAKCAGAKRVVAFDHNVRCLSRAKQGEAGIQGPIKSAHNDYTADSAAQRVRDLIPAKEAENSLSKRFAVINVWRPMKGPVEAHPLAVCDAARRAMRAMLSQSDSSCCGWS